jgi:hypothetical protein
VAIAGASAVAGLLETTTGCLSLVLVILFTHFFGRGLGHLSEGFASLGIAGAMLASNHVPLAAGSIGRCALAIAAAWLCAGLVSRRPRQPSSTTRLKDDPFDLPIDQLSRDIWSRTGDGELEYVCQSILDYSGRTFEELRWPYTLTHPDDVGIPAQAFERAKETGEAHADETMQSIRALFKRQSVRKRTRNVKDMVLEAVRLLREDETKQTARSSSTCPIACLQCSSTRYRFSRSFLTLFRTA